MTKSKFCELVYRATNDGFTYEALHSKCDDKQNLVSIIRNNLNYVCFVVFETLYLESPNPTIICICTLSAVARQQ